MKDSWTSVFSLLLRKSLEFSAVTVNSKGPVLFFLESLDSRGIEDDLGT